MNYTPQDFGDLSSPASLERTGKWGEKVAALPRAIRRGRLIREAGVDWKSLPGWKGLKDVDRVYYNPNIDDQTLWCPRVDLFEEDTGHLLVEVELPGVPREDIGLELDEDDEDGSMSLTIAALKPQRPKEESACEAQGVYHIQERHYGRFFRTVRLPYKVERDLIRAHISEGVLHVHLTMKTSKSRIHIGEREDEEAASASAKGKEKDEQAK